MAKASPDVGLLQGFAEKDNCAFGQGAQTHLRKGGAFIIEKRKGLEVAISKS
jgi:hypothetical protein